jgi:SHS2 domain-containing protein
VTFTDFQVIEHTADVGISVRASTREDLYSKASLAMFALMAERKNNAPAQLHSQTISVMLSAANREELLVNWLNELLSLSAVKGVVFLSFVFDELSDTNLRATAQTEGIKHYQVNTEIKAATYHELSVEHNQSEWKARVIFDV